MRNQFIVVSALFALVGCVPEFEGTAEYTFKSSEVLKALSGQPARIRLHENVSHPISNAYERVTFGGGRYTNQLDVVRELVKSQSVLVPFVAKDVDWSGKMTKTNEYVRLSVDEQPGQLPILRMEADIAVWLSQTNVLARALAAQKVDELLVLGIDPRNGELKEVDCEKFSQVNLRQFAYKMTGLQQYVLLTELFGSEKESILTMAGAYAALPAMPEFISDKFFAIVGDSDEPLVVEAEDVIVDGKHHDTFKATVKRGETLRLKVNKKHGEIRFGKDCQRARFVK